MDTRGTPKAINRIPNKSVLAKPVFMTSTASVAIQRRFNKNDLFRWCRIVHGWLSAIAFLALCFFAVTGILLNHPAWIEGGKSPAPIEQELTLSADELTRVRAAPEPEREIVTVVAPKVSFRGEVTGANQVGNEVFVRMQGVRGFSDLRGNLITGAVTVLIEPVRTTSILNELHRAEHAGTAWRLAVDVIACVLLLMSVIGFLIFLSLRFRLRAALILMAASTLGLWSIFVLAVA
jgi:hypothetical protein